MRVMLKSKIHRARVSEANINYEGSITIDRQLMEAADILPYEQVQVLNINNGARFSTYAIEGDRGSGEICLNGAAARLAVKGDTVIILSYCHVENDEAQHFTPKLVYVDAQNAITEVKDTVEAILS
jgi:aspartate 1-decarboxylase